MTDEKAPAIPLLVPDLPAAPEIAPWLQRIDAARWYTNFGPLVRQFEATLAQHLTGPGLPTQVVSVNSGTAALELAIAALALPAGAKVLLPAFTFVGTGAAVLRQGLVPVFADVAPDTWQLTPKTAREAARRQRIALVLPVATFGCPLDAGEWDAFVEETAIPVLIDAAGAFGNQSIGERATVAFSFHATKPFGIGEGGAVVTRNAALADRVRSLSNFGFEHGLVHEAGTNAKLSEYAAAVALAQWERWPAGQARRRRLWQTYAAELDALPGVTLQQGVDRVHLPATLVVKLSVQAHRVIQELAQAGIQTRRWYCPPLHHHAAFAACPRSGPAGGDRLPVTEHLALHTLGVPWFVGLQPEQCLAVADALRASLEGGQVAMAGVTEQPCGEER